MTRVNKARGEISIKGPDGEQWIMCLTLGAISQLEEELEIDSLVNIDEVIGENPKFKVLMIILCALLAGGGHTIRPDSEEMMTWKVDLKEVMEKVRDCFAAGFGQQAEVKEDMLPPDYGDDQAEEEKRPKK